LAIVIDWYHFRHFITPSLLLSPYAIIGFFLCRWLALRRLRHIAVFSWLIDCFVIFFTITLRAAFRFHFDFRHMLFISLLIFAHWLLFSHYCWIRFQIRHFILILHVIDVRLSLRHFHYTLAFHTYSWCICQLISFSIKAITLSLISLAFFSSFSIRWCLMPLSLLFRLSYFHCIIFITLLLIDIIGLMMLAIFSFLMPLRHIITYMPLPLLLIIADVFFFCHYYINTHFASHCRCHYYYAIHIIITPHIIITAAIISLLILLLAIEYYATPL